MIGVREVHLVPGNPAFGWLDAQKANEGQLERALTQPLPQSRRTENKLSHDTLVVGVNLLDSSDVAPRRITNSASEQLLDVDLVGARRHDPGIRSTILRRSQSSNALIGVSSAARSI